VVVVVLTIRKAERQRYTDKSKELLCKNIIKGGDSFCIVDDRNREDGEQKNDLG